MIEPIILRPKLARSNLTVNLAFRKTCKYATELEKLAEATGYKKSDIIDLMVRKVIDDKLIKIEKD